MNNVKKRKNVKVHSKLHPEQRLASRDRDTRRIERGRILLHKRANSEAASAVAARHLAATSRVLPAAHTGLRAHQVEHNREGDREEAVLRGVARRHHPIGPPEAQGPDTVLQLHARVRLGEPRVRVRGPAQRHHHIAQDHRHRHGQARRVRCRRAAARWLQGLGFACHLQV